MEESNVKFFFSVDNNTLQIPVNPPELRTISILRSDKEEVVSLGDVEILRGRALKEVTFEAFFPGSKDYPFLEVEDPEKPATYIKFFEDLQEKRSPVKFIIAGLNLNFTNMLVSVYSFEKIVKAGEHEDVYYNIVLHEYRSFGAKKLQMVESLQEEEEGVGKIEAETETRMDSADKFCVGDDVVVSGSVFRDIDSLYAELTLKNNPAKIGMIDPLLKDVFHLVGVDGSWLGWVNKVDIVKQTAQNIFNSYKGKFRL